MALTISDIIRDRVRTAILAGKTIDAIMQAYGVGKRFVENERMFLRAQYGTIPNRQIRTGSGAEVRRLSDQGLSAREISIKLGVSTSYVYQQRRES